MQENHPSNKTVAVYSNHSANVDIIYGTICSLNFLIGTLGNIISFCFFKSKRRDISNVIYKFITVNDIVVSITVLPIGVCYLSARQPGLIFGYQHRCLVWMYFWKLSIGLSVFLVMCLSISRTISLMNPFKRQKINHFIAAAIAYLILIVAVLTRISFSEDSKPMFIRKHARCDWTVYDKSNDTYVHVLEMTTNFSAGFGVFKDILLMMPAFVVLVGCVISGVLLTRKNENFQQQPELRMSRNKATVTILLFALLYGVCNAPILADSILRTYSYSIKTMAWYNDLHQFDRQFYYSNAVNTILLAVNAGANPILYFLRMPSLRQFTFNKIVRIWVQIRGLKKSKNRVIPLTEKTINSFHLNPNTTSRIPGTMESTKL